MLTFVFRQREIDIINRINDNAIATLLQLFNYKS